MPLSAEEIKRIATLARIEVTEDELEGVRGQLNGIFANKAIYYAWQSTPRASTPYPPISELRFALWMDKIVAITIGTSL